MRYYLPVLLFLTGCCSFYRPAISGRSEYIDESYLASSAIGTPDPGRLSFSGQQVVVNWKLPVRCLPALIVLSLRYGNGEHEEVNYEVCVPRGFWIFRLLNKDFLDKQGICSYSAKIFYDGVLIEQYNHHLWAEIIEIKE